MPSEKQNNTKRSKKKKMLGLGDPPILVGGGGSTLIWIRNDVTLTQIRLKDVLADAPTPDTKDNYQIYQCGTDVTISTVRLNQQGGKTKHTGLDPKKHSTGFE